MNEITMRIIECYGNAILTDDIVHHGATLLRRGIDKDAVINEIADRLNPIWALTHTMDDFRQLCQKAFKEA
jgi:hypothetical protein